MSKYIRRGSVRLQLHATDEKVKQPSQGKKTFFKRNHAWKGHIQCPSILRLMSWLLGNQGLIYGNNHQVD